MPLPPDALFDEICRRHGHRCPMSTLGGRMGYAALRHLGVAGGADLEAVCTMRTCAVDGIRCATGCSEAAGSLRIDEGDRHALVLKDRQSGVAVEVELTDAAFALSGAYRRFREEAHQRRPQLDAAGIAALDAECERRLEALLRRLRTIAQEELLACRPVSLQGPGAVDA